MPSSKGFHLLRASHKWAGMVFALLFALIAATGFLLALKSRVPALRPAVVKAEPAASMSEVISMDRAVQAALGAGVPVLQTVKDIDRVDYRPKDNIFKVLSKTGYREVQVCGKTARVLQVAVRNDQFIEDLHDLSFWNDALRVTALPLVALTLFGMTITGIGIWLVPTYRRWKFRRTAQGGRKDDSGSPKI